MVFYHMEEKFSHFIMGAFLMEKLFKLNPKYSENKQLDSKMNNNEWQFYSSSRMK